ncbi:hypothetical protein Ahy_Scaffold1g107147 isoform B [Arachis hypogaea]|uniref:Uncharacterized protein n=1 Tax=Arachis hypogaea TaxID=3818 RepID=A0A444WUQ8_ARAHY|nr:hypothetical protein Ahy_Scaffold1g107147 isoform B [Arachis hypogaea]
MREMDERNKRTIQVETWHRNPSTPAPTKAAPSSLSLCRCVQSRELQPTVFSSVFNQEDFNQLCSAIANLLDCTSWSGAGPGLMDDVTQGAHQELKANKEELRVEKLKDKEEVEDLTHEMAELRYRTLTPRPQASSLQLKSVFSLTPNFKTGKKKYDIEAEIFGVKDILPPYLDPNLQLQELLTGVSFASGGAGYDPLTSKAAGAMSLSDQLDKLGEYQKKIREAVGENRAETIVSKSIYIVCLGSDDIANTYLPFRQSQYDIPSYTDLMASLAFTFLKG